MSVIVNNTTFPAEYLSDPKEITNGMSGRNELNGCMVFKVGMGHHSFWMKGCKMNLDIVFVVKNKISKIHHNCKPCDSDCNEKYHGIGDHVVEFPGGTAEDWKVGDKINMYLGTKSNPVH